MNLRSLPIISFALRGPTKVLTESRKNACGSHFVFQNEAKNIPRQDFMVMNISCKFEKASYNIIFVRAVTVKSLYTLRRRRNEAKSIVSTGCYPVDTITTIKLWSESNLTCNKISIPFYILTLR